MIRAQLNHAAAELAAAGIDASSSDARSLAAHVLGLTVAQLHTRLALGDEAFGPEQLSRFDELIRLRAERVPLQHLTGIAYFRHVEVRVGPGVFVPRPETELLAGLGISALRRAHQRRTCASPSAGVGADDARAVAAADLCAGSAAMTLSLALEAPGSQVFGVELSKEAFAWSEQNLAAYRDRLAETGSKVELVRADAATALAGHEAGIDVVVSNPPYIPHGATPVDPEVRDHDPDMALYGGSADGLRIPAAIAQRAGALLVDDGYFAMEHSEEQGATVRYMLQSQEIWAGIETHRDLTGRDRVTAARRIKRQGTAPD
ncbi:peptide chain release factor N(5)-glutamine methyltransferase [Saxibacter everestensis]|uniref:peptide chain release factor N(5)-glutamine methyltransferase n=1 Tax=Saxibacter everestensis TaxID=2909229 RepID=A0ABY8QQ56_9MICO|nr:peptide chain release factor N(5)-glutamine methyltransferase [Brevibacteriaceae bacterium ZFBP1038]